MQEKYNLSTHGDRKSFYGKAKVIKDDDENIIYLQSYSTLVAKIEGGIFKKMWDDYSNTTMRHINAFLKEFNFHTLTKKEWMDLPVSA